MIIAPNGARIITLFPAEELPTANRDELTLNRPTHTAPALDVPPNESAAQLLPEAIDLIEPG